MTSTKAAANAVSFSGAHPVWLVDLQWYSKQMGGGMTTEWTTLSDEDHFNKANPELVILRQQLAAAEAERDDLQKQALPVPRPNPARRVEHK